MSHTLNSEDAVSFQGEHRWGNSGLLFVSSFAASMTISRILATYLSAPHSPRHRVQEDMVAVTVGLHIESELANTL